MEALRPESRELLPRAFLVEEDLAAHVFYGIAAAAGRRRHDAVGNIRPTVHLHARLQQRHGEIDRIALDADEARGRKRLRHQVGAGVQHVDLGKCGAPGLALARAEERQHVLARVGRERRRDPGAIAAEPAVPDLQAVIRARPPVRASVEVTHARLGAGKHAPDRSFRGERRTRKHGREIREIRQRQAVHQELGSYRRAGSGAAADDDDRTPRRRSVPVACTLEGLSAAGRTAARPAR